MKRSLLMTLMAFTTMSLFAARMTADQWMKDLGKKPRFSGEFEVGIYFIDFPDTKPIDVDECFERLTEGVADYYKVYTQGVCWPRFKKMNDSIEASNPLGYYCAYRSSENRIGWTDAAEGQRRLEELRDDVIRDFATSSYPRKESLPPVLVFAYATSRRYLDELDKISLLRNEYPKREDNLNQSRYSDPLSRYQPPTCWLPTSSRKSATIDIRAMAQPSALIHQLGHVLGEGDCRHTCEVSGGVPGEPIRIGGGPTGPLFSRWKSCAYLPANAYTLVKEDAEITLAPRWSKFDGTTPLGVFIQTSHPNYLLHLEYEPEQVKEMVYDESSCGDVSEATSVTGGVHAYYVRIPACAYCFGHPDLAYSYRSNDPYLHGEVGGVATFREGDCFDQTSDPPSILPNQLPTEVVVEFGEQTLDGAQLKIKVPPKMIRGAALTQSLLPIVDLGEISDIHAGSFVAKMYVRFRGEPLLTERGLVCGKRAHPKLEKDIVWRMEGIGYDDTRVTGLEPGKYYVRAYAKSPLGVTYSENEEEVVVPDYVENTEPLIVHRLNNAGAFTQSSITLPLLMLSEYARQYWTDAGSPVKNKKRSKTNSDLQNRYTREPRLDLHRIHGNPHGLRYPPTVEAFRALVSTTRESLRQLGLSEHAVSIPDNFEENLKAILNVSPRSTPPENVKGKGKSKSRFSGKAKADNSSRGIYFVYDLNNKDLTEALPEIKQALSLGAIPYVFRHSVFTSSERMVDVCLIDGYREEAGEAQLHLVFAFGKDRYYRTRRKTGWHKASDLLEDVWKAYLVIPNAPLPPPRKSKYH